MNSHLNFHRNLPLLFSSLILFPMILFSTPTLYATSDWHGIVVTHSDALNIRSGPTIKDPIIGRAVKGERLLIKGLSGDWYLVKLYDGTVGYVHANHVDLVGGGASHLKYFGLGDWFYERDCPDIELFWKEDTTSKTLDSAPYAYFRIKNGRVLKLGRGIANFSPNCKYFWFTEYSSLNFKLFNTTYGQMLEKISGLYPVWSQNTRSIYFMRKHKQYELWRYSMLNGQEELIFAVNDYLEEIIVGGKMDWVSVEFDDKGNIVWTYPAKDQNENETEKDTPVNKENAPFQIKKMTLNPETKKKIKEEWINIS